ncbi:MAG: hypothetical protein AAFN42_17040 [Cyanobacteria bacterium J06554_1]
MNIAAPRYDFICETPSHGISHRAIHPLNQQRQNLTLIEHLPKKCGILGDLSGIFDA